jgi:arylsulfatase A-like enzyme
MSVTQATRPADACGSVWERPPKQKGNNLNLIVIVSDTFRRDNLACYGNKWIENLETSNLDRFAQDSMVFDDFYPEGMPTIVIRRNLYTGRRTVPCYYFRQQGDPVQLPGWHDLYNEDVTLGETLLESGYLTALISDIPHQQRPGRNFHRGFHVYQWIRGQEIDYYGTSPHKLLDVSDIVPSSYLARFPGLHPFLSQYKANRALWQHDGESLSQIVAETAIRWLKSNSEQQPFYLHVEFFDPHEPWDPPARFLEKYMPDAKGPTYIEPPYGTVPLSDDIKQRFRANYAGEVTCLDFWLGKLFDAMGQLGVFDNTVVIFMGDHGTLLGEQGQFVKGPEKLRGQVNHIPLLIRLPGKEHAGKHVSGLIQITDMMPTWLHLLGLKSPSRVTGTNFWPLVSGETTGSRDFTVQTYGWIAAIRTSGWNYSETWKPEGQRQPYKPQLYNLERDPQELTNVAETYPDVARQLSARLKEYVASGEGVSSGSFNEKPSLDVGEVYVRQPR